MALKNKLLYKDDKRIYIFLGIMSLIVFLLSSSVLPFISDGKVGPEGNLVLCFVCLIPAFVPMKSAAIFALVLGFLCDLFIYSPESFSPIVFLVGVFVVSYLYRFFSRTGTLVMAVCSLPCLALKMVLDTFAVMASHNDSGAFDVISKLTLPSLAINFAFAIAAAFILRLLTKKLGIFHKN